MKIGIISDAHGNYEATKCCIDFLHSENVEDIYFLGDMIGYFPECLEVYNLLKENNVKCILGNHEYFLSGKVIMSDRTEEMIKHNHCRKVLSDEIKDEITNYKVSRILTINDIDVVFIHSLGGDEDPFLDEEYKKENTILLSPKKIIFRGHSHRANAEIYNDDSLKIVDVGSCGYPRDSKNTISVCVFNSEKDFNNNTIIHRLPFDFEKILKKYKDKIHYKVREYYER